MRRPLAPLKLPYFNRTANGKIPTGRDYVVSKNTTNKYDVVTIPTFADLEADEVRALHTWLGKVVEDLDAGL